MANLVAGVVLTVLGELDAEALVGATMDAAEEAFDDVTRDQAESAVFGEDGRIEERYPGAAIRLTSSFPRSAWERTAATLCVADEMPRDIVLRSATVRIISRC